MLALVVGTSALAAGFGAALLAGRRVAARWMPTADPGCRALATIVVALTIVLATAQLLGAVGQLRPIVTLVAVVSVSAACALAGRRGEAAPRTRRTARWQTALHAGVGVVALRWLALAGDALTSGMKQADTLWYHLPFAARIVQERGFPELDGLGYAAARWFPLDAQLVHALGIMATQSDALSPFVNLAWAALALAAAHTIGRRHDRAELTTLAAAAVLMLPILAATQAGQASTDIPVAALCLTAVALLLSTRLTAGTVAIAGGALGLAVSTKTTAAAFGAVMALAVLVILVTRRNPRAAAAWTASVAATGTFWFVRNWVLTGNPLPWFDVPGRVDKRVDQDGPALVRSVFDGDQWSALYLPGLRQGLSAVWPLVLVVVVVVVVLLLVRGRSVERAVAVAVAAGFVLHVLTPLTGGLTFAFNLRYLAPTLLVAIVLLPTVLPRGARWDVVAAVLLGSIVVAGAFSRHREGAPPWTFVPATWALVVLVAVGIAAVASRHRGAVAAAVALVIVVAAPALESRYLDGRYVDSGLVGDPVAAYFRDIEGARVGVLGAVETLPMFGLRLRNDVEIAVDVDDPPAGDECVAWRRLLADRYTHVVVYGTSYGFGLYLMPRVDVLSSDPSAHVAMQDGDTVVLAVDDAGFDADACPTT